jgi:hypothetical protein
VKDYCSRARAALNLVLVLSLLQIWLQISQPNSPEAIGEDLHHLVVFFARYLGGPQPGFADLEPLRPPLDAFVKALKATRSGNWDGNWDDVSLDFFVNADPSAVGRALNEVFGNPNPKDSKVFDGVMLSPEQFAEEADQAYLHIRKLAQRSGLAPTATVRELKNANEHPLELPAIKQSINPEDAGFVLQAALLFPLALLMVLLDSMPNVLAQMKANGEDIGVADCVFFYRSWLSFPIGVLWLLFPALCILLEGWNHPALRYGEASNPEKVVHWVTFILVGWCIVRAWKSRKVYWLPNPGDAAVAPPP